MSISKSYTNYIWGLPLQWRRIKEDRLVLECSTVVEYLPSMCELLGSILAQKRIERERGKRREEREREEKERERETERETEREREKQALELDY
jgi:hypothetical protein